MEIKPNEVRLGTRIVIVDDWGADVTARKVDHFKTRLQTILEESGYKPRIYTEGTGSITGDSFAHEGHIDQEPEAIAYIKREVPFREEPVLVDDAGSTFGGYPVLKVAVRDARQSNREVCGLIEKVLRIYGVSPEEASRGNYQPTAEGTIVFALRRDTDDDSENVGYQHIDDLLSSQGIINSNVLAEITKQQ